MKRLLAIPPRSKKRIWHHCKKPISFILTGILAVLCLPLALMGYLIVGAAFHERANMLPEWGGFGHYFLAILYSVFSYPAIMFLLHIPRTSFDTKWLLKVLPHIEYGSWLWRTALRKTRANYSERTAWIMDAYSDLLSSLMVLSETHNRALHAQYERQYEPRLSIPFMTTRLYCRIPFGKKDVSGKAVRSGMASVTRTHRAQEDTQQ